MITPGNELNVHHVLIYSCRNINSSYDGVQGNCYERDRPLPDCYDVVIAWAIGGEVSHPYNFVTVQPKWFSYHEFGRSYAMMLKHYNFICRCRKELTWNGLISIALYIWRLHSLRTKAVRGSCMAFLFREVAKSLSLVTAKVTGQWRPSIPKSLIIFEF